MKRLWSRISAMFKPDQPAVAPACWTPASVEARIEMAGRAEVFAEARRLGWSAGSSPPLYVWGMIASDIIARNSPEQRATMH